ncbi:ErfK/YbiS/YcfS/YnhG family protein [Myxococcus stipitatus DSM 14675]|uniref:ErfK/YbiS/YcfS/YnhG family protein n=1 Tax=Myxococcus stipitatus (strain DSM 14675 / JCM 12634 / Mx s8) TaxID=1278073 RepID=L7UJ29_MYXSD|nr:L,D-transpeptidase family protein [Myxococcus stipitatus]AGC47557.1 ErfK/YbiS/YcfS/YnhG family protein [Myxococcus stipitatus DSM 14675]
MTSSISRIESLLPLPPLEADDAPLGGRWPPARRSSRLHDNTVESAPTISLSRPPSPRVETGPTPPAPPAPPLTHARFTQQPQLADVASGHLVLGPGSRGDGLRAVQTALLKMGFALHGGADGHFGAQTQRALRNFQTHASLTFPAVKPTGLLDSATLHALEALAPEPGMRGQPQGLPLATYDGEPVRVIVALREHRTFLYDTEGRIVDIVPNASGTPATPTRPGLKVVKTRLHQAAAEAAGERLWNDRSVFGARILDLSWADGRHSGEELHGTNAPALLGGDVSHGCIRHSNEAIIALHDALSVGDRVAIVEHVNDPRLGGQAPVARGTTLPRAAPSARAPAG